MTTTTSTTTNFVNNQPTAVDRNINIGQVDATSAMIAASALVITTPEKAAVVGENNGDIVIKADSEAITDVQSVMPIPLGEFYFLVMKLLYKYQRWQSGSGIRRFYHKLSGIRIRYFRFGFQFFLNMKILIFNTGKFYLNGRYSK